jgi:pyrroloquinoline quinone biosynthesis protein D
VSAPRLAAKARLKWDRRESRYMLLYPERGMTLNEAAASILKLCDGVRTVDDIARELAAAANGADEATIKRDVTAFLEEMRKRGLMDGL